MKLIGETNQRERGVLTDPTYAGAMYRQLTSEQKDSRFHLGDLDCTPDGTRLYVNHDVRAALLQPR